MLLSSCQSRYLEAARFSCTSADDWLTAFFAEATAPHIVAIRMLITLIANRVYEASIARD